MDTKELKEKGLVPFLRMLDDLGGWPVLKGKTWRQEDFQWFHLTGKFRDIGLSADFLFDISVTPDLRNSSRRVLDLDTPRLGINREYLINGLSDEAVKVEIGHYCFRPKVFQAYLSFMKNVAVQFGADIRSAEQEMQDVLQFEMKLASFSLSRQGHHISINFM